MSVWFAIRGMRSKLSSWRGTKGSSEMFPEGGGADVDGGRLEPAAGCFYNMGVTIWISWFGLPVFAKVTKSNLFQVMLHQQNIKKRDILYIFWKHNFRVWMPQHVPSQSFPFKFWSASIELLPARTFCLFKSSKVTWACDERAPCFRWWNEKLWCSLWQVPLPLWTIKQKPTTFFFW